MNETGLGPGREKRKKVKWTCDGEGLRQQSGLPYDGWQPGRAGDAVFGSFLLDADACMRPGLVPAAL
eukprot:4060055-Amphidinium_carterae.2